MAETNISVRFSVQDAETVRAALEKLGTDGQKALSKLNAAGQAPSEGLKAVSAVVDELKTKATGLAFSIGPLGTGLVALGPVGLAAAAGLGLIVEAMRKVSEMANQLGEKAIQLRSFAETTSLTTDQVQGLTRAAQAHGVAADQVVGAIQRFTQGWEQMRQGGGDLLTQLNRINPSLVLQMQQAKDAAAGLGYFFEGCRASRNIAAKSVAAGGGWARRGCFADGRCSGYRQRWRPQ